MQYVPTRPDRKSQVRQYLDFLSADLWAKEDQKSDPNIA